MVWVVFANPRCRTGLSVLAPCVDWLSPAVTRCRYIRYNLLLLFCPVNIECCRIGGFTFFHASRSFGLLVCDASLCGLYMTRIIFASPRCRALSVLAPCVDWLSPAVSRCRNVFHRLTLRGCPAFLKGCCVQSCALFRAGRSLCYFMGYSRFCCFYPIGIGLVGTSCNAARSVLTPLIFRSIPFRTCGRNIRNHLFLSSRPAFLKGCCISGFSRFRLCGIFGRLTCDCSYCRFCMAWVVFTSPRCRAGVSVLAPCIDRFYPDMFAKFSVACSTYITGSLFRTGSSSAAVSPLINPSYADIAFLPVMVVIMLPFSCCSACVLIYGHLCGRRRKNSSICFHTNLVGSVTEARHLCSCDLFPYHSSGKLVFHCLVNTGNLAVILIGSSTVCASYTRRCFCLCHVDGLYFRVGSGSSVTRHIDLNIIFSGYSGNLLGFVENFDPGISTINTVFHARLKVGKPSPAVSRGVKCRFRSPFLPWRGEIRLNTGIIAESHVPFI